VLLELRPEWWVDNYKNVVNEKKTGTEMEICAFCRKPEHTQERCFEKKKQLKSTQVGTVMAVKVDWQHRTKW